MSRCKVHKWLPPQTDDLTASCGACGHVVDLRSERFTPVMARSWFNAIQHRQGSGIANQFRKAFLVN